MHLHFKDFWLCLVPLFVAVDVLGTIPIFASLVGNADRARVHRMIKTSVFTALLVAVPFIFLGKWVFKFLGITVADFMIAGGLILLLLSIRSIMVPEKEDIPKDLDTLGPVPLGVPLIVGPAVLTTIMLLVSQYGFAMTTAATVLNIVIAGVVLTFANRIILFMGNTGTRIASKIANLFLAAIAVMLIRKGVIATLSKNFLFW